MNDHEHLYVSPDEIHADRAASLQRAPASTASLSQTEWWLDLTSEKAAVRARLAAQEAEVLAAHHAGVARARAKEAAKEAALRRRQATTNGAAYAHIQSKIGQQQSQAQTGRASSPLPADSAADAPPPSRKSSKHTRNISSVSQASDGSATSAATSASLAASVAASASVAESVSAASIGSGTAAAAMELPSPTGSVVTFADMPQQQHPSSSSAAAKHRGNLEMLSPVSGLRPGSAAAAAAASGPYTADESSAAHAFGTVAASNQMRARGILTPDRSAPSVAPGLPGKRALEYRVPAPRATAQSGVPFEPKHVPMRMVDAISLASHDVVAAAQKSKRNAAMDPAAAAARSEEKESSAAAAFRSSAASSPSSTILAAASAAPIIAATPASATATTTALSPIKLTRKQARAAARAEAALITEFPMLDRTGTSLPPRTPDLTASQGGHSVLGGPPRGDMAQPTYADSARKVAALAAVAARPNPDARLIYSKVAAPLSQGEEKEGATSTSALKTPEQVRARAMELMAQLTPPAAQRRQLNTSASTPLLSSKSPASSTSVVVSPPSTAATTAAPATPAAPLSASAAAHALIYETPPLVPQVAPESPPLIESVPPLPDPGTTSAATVLWEFRELGEHAHHVRRTVFDNPLATRARQERAERDAAAEARADALDAAREKRAGLSINLAHLEKFRTKQHLLTAEESAAIKHAATHLTSLTHAILPPQALQTLLSPTLSASMDLDTRDGRETLAELRFLQGTQIEMLSAQQSSFKERLMRDFFIREAQERIAVQGKIHTDAIVRECAMKVRCAQRYLTHQYAQLEADHHAQNQDQQRWVEMEAEARGANRARERKARKAAGEAAKVKAFAVASSAPLLAAEAHAEILKANRIALQAVKTRYALYHDAHRGDPSDARVLEAQSVPANRQQRKAAQASNVFHVMKPRESLHDPTPLRNEFESTNPTVPAGNAALVFLTSFRPAPSKLDKMLSVPVLHDRDAHATHLGLLVDAPRSDAYVVGKIRAAAMHTAARAEKCAAEAAAGAEGSVDAPKLFQPSRPDLTREERGRERLAWARAEEAKKARLLMERKKAREDARRDKLRVRSGVDVEEDEAELDDADRAAAEVRQRLKEEAEEAAILGHSLRDADRALKRSGSAAAATEPAKTDSEIEEEAMADLEAEMKAKLALREAIERESRPKPTIPPVTAAAPGSKQDLYARLASVAALASSASAPVLPVAAAPRKVSAHTAAIEAAAPHMIARQLELIKHVLPQGTERERRIKARIRNEMLMDFEFDAQNYDPFGFIQGLLPTPASPVVPATATPETPSSEQSTARPGWNQPNPAAASTPKHARGRTMSISFSASPAGAARGRGLSIGSGASLAPTADSTPASTTRSRPGSISTAAGAVGSRSRRSDSISSPGGAGGTSPGAGAGASPLSTRAHGRALSMSPSRGGASSELVTPKDADVSPTLRPYSPQVALTASLGLLSLPSGPSSAATSASPTPRSAHARSATSAGLSSSASAPSLEVDAQSPGNSSSRSVSAGLRPPSAGSSSGGHTPILGRPSSSSSRRVLVHSFSAPLVEKIEIHRELHADELRFELERASEAIEEEDEVDLDGPLSPSYAAADGEIDPAAPPPTSFSFDVPAAVASTAKSALHPSKNAPNAPLLMSAPASTPKAAATPATLGVAAAPGQTPSPSKVGFQHSSRALVSTAAPVLSARVVPDASDVTSEERVRRVQLIRPTMLAMSRACLKKCPAPILHGGQQSWRYYAPPHGLQKPWLSGLNVEYDELEEAADAAAMRKHQEAQAKRRAQEMHEDSARRIVQAASLTYEEANHTPPSMSRPASALLRSPLPITSSRPTTAKSQRGSIGGSLSVNSSRPGTPLTLHPSAAMIDAASSAADSPRSSVGGESSLTSRLQTPVVAAASVAAAPAVIWDQSSPPPVSPYFLNAAGVLTTKGPASGGGESVKALKAKWSKVESKLDVGGGGAGASAGKGKKTKSKSKPKKSETARRVSVVAEGTGESMVVHGESDDDNDDGKEDQQSDAASDTDTSPTRGSLRPATATTRTSGGFATQRSDSTATTSDGSVSVRDQARVIGGRPGKSSNRNKPTPLRPFRDLSATPGYGTTASNSPSAPYYPSNVLPLSSDIALTPSRWEKAKQMQTRSPSDAAAAQAARQKGTRDGVPLSGVLNASTTLSILHHVAAEVTLDLADPLHSPELRAKRAVHAGGRGISYGNLVQAQRKMEEGADRAHVALTSRNAVDHAASARKQLRSPQANNGSASARASPSSSTALIARNETVAAPLPALVLTPRALARRRMYTSSVSARVHPVSDYALKSWLASHGKIFKQPILPQENSGPHSVLFQSIAAKDSPFKIQAHDDGADIGAPSVPSSHNMMDQPVDMRDVLHRMFDRVNGGHVPLNQLQVRALEKMFLMHFAGGMAHAEVERVQMRDIATAAEKTAAGAGSTKAAVKEASISSVEANHTGKLSVGQFVQRFICSSLEEWSHWWATQQDLAKHSTLTSKAAAAAAKHASAVTALPHESALLPLPLWVPAYHRLKILERLMAPPSLHGTAGLSSGGAEGGAVSAGEANLDLVDLWAHTQAGVAERLAEFTDSSTAVQKRISQEEEHKFARRLHRLFSAHLHETLDQSREQRLDAREAQEEAMVAADERKAAARALRLASPSQVAYDSKMEANTSAYASPRKTPDARSLSPAKLRPNSAAGIAASLSDVCGTTVVAPAYARNQTVAASIMLDMNARLKSETIRLQEVAAAANVVEEDPEAVRKSHARTSSAIRARAAATGAAASPSTPLHRHVRTPTQKGLDAIFTAGANLPELLASSSSSSSAQNLTPLPVAGGQRQFFIDQQQQQQPPQTAPTRPSTSTEIDVFAALRPSTAAASELHSMREEAARQARIQEAKDAAMRAAQAEADERAAAKAATSLSITVDMPEATPVHHGRQLSVFIPHTPSNAISTVSISIEGPSSPADAATTAAPSLQSSQQPSSSNSLQVTPAATRRPSLMESNADSILAAVAAARGGHSPRPSFSASSSTIATPSAASIAPPLVPILLSPITAMHRRGPTAVLHRTNLVAIRHNLMVLEIQAQKRVDAGTAFDAPASEEMRRSRRASLSRPLNSNARLLPEPSRASIDLTGTTLADALSSPPPPARPVFLIDPSIPIQPDVDLQRLNWAELQAALSSVRSALEDALSLQAAEAGENDDDDEQQISARVLPVLNLPGPAAPPSPDSTAPSSRRAPAVSPKDAAADRKKRRATGRLIDSDDEDAVFSSDDEGKDEKDDDEDPGDVISKSLTILHASQIGRIESEAEEAARKLAELARRKIRSVNVFWHPENGLQSTTGGAMVVARKKRASVTSLQELSRAATPPVAAAAEASSPSTPLVSESRRRSLEATSILLKDVASQLETRAADARRMSIGKGEMPPVSAATFVASAATSAASAAASAAPTLPPAPAVSATMSMALAMGNVVRNAMLASLKEKAGALLPPPTADAAALIAASTPAPAPEVIVAPEPETVSLDSLLKSAAAEVGADQSETKKIAFESIKSRGAVEFESRAVTLGSALSKPSPLLVASHSGRLHSSAAGTGHRGFSATALLNATLGLPPRAS